jgi:hypothetical protein
MNLRGTIFACVWLAALPLLAQPSTAPATNTPAVASPPDSRVEQIRAACIAGRRHVCGRVLQITPAGLVVDSGYTSLLTPPFNRSWVTRGNVALSRPPALVEANAPDSIAVGLVLLTDLPRRPSVHRYDYVSLIGYPSGKATYSPVAGVTKTLRLFSGGLEHAVNLKMKAEKQ